MLVEKSEAFDCFKIFKKKVEIESGKQVKALRTDRGGEFTSDLFNTFCREDGIQKQSTIAFTPQQNGVAERRNRYGYLTSLRCVQPKLWQIRLLIKPGVEKNHM